MRAWMTLSIGLLLSCSAAGGGGDDGASAGVGGAGGSTAGSGFGASGGAAGNGGSAATGGTAAGNGGAAGSGGSSAAGGSSAGSSGAGGAGGVSGSGGAGGSNPCTLGDICNPIPIDAFPYSDSRDTTQAPSDQFDSYDCAPSTDESGGEYFYELTLDERGIVSIDVSDEAGVDIDVHLLDGPDAGMCLARDDTSISLTLDPGTYFLVADTWTNGSGIEQSGPYTLNVDFIPLAGGACETYPLDLKMFWTSCDPSLDCFEGVDSSDGQTYRWLRTPAVGPVVKEAHLVTVMDDFGGGWPNSFTDQIDEHYALSQAATGYVMNRSEPWAPAGEGGSEFGQGSTGAPLPVIEEAWYVNMYWRDRPAKGTRMIVRNPANGRAVVAAAGYETGPGNNSRIGGASEEIHHYLGTSHLDTLEMGFAVDDSLPFGPIDCQ